MRKNPSYTALLRPTRLLISEKAATYTIKWSYTIIWQVRVIWVNDSVHKYVPVVNTYLLMFLPCLLSSKKKGAANILTQICVVSFDFGIDKNYFYQ